MNRRKFLCGLTLGLLAVPLAAEAEQVGKTWRIGFLYPASPTELDARFFVESFRQELRQLGYAEGQNLTIEFRWGEGSDDRLRQLAEDLVRREVALIVAPTNPAVIAAKKATSTIPIVAAIAADPIGLGFVKSFAKPGGNTTGVAYSLGCAFHLLGRRLTLPAASIHDEAHRRGAPPPPGPGSVAAHSATPARPSPAISVSGSRCNSRRTSTESPADAARPLPRHGQGTPAESSQSRAPHRRFATASVAQ